MKVDVGGVEELVARVLSEIERAEEEAGGLGSMTDFGEYDLFEAAEAAGFETVRLEAVVERKPEPMIATRDWDTFLRFAPNPISPTLGEAVERALSPDEVAELTAVLRPQVEAHRGVSRYASCFLAARKS